MYKCILFLLISILVNFTSESRAENDLLVVTDFWPPYVFEENGKIVGADYDVMLAVFSRMGYEVDFRILPWKRCLHMINALEADAILDVSMNEERKDKMYFPQEKISDSSSVLFYLKGKQFDFEKLQDLKGMRIGIILGYEYNKEFLEADYFVREPVSNEKQNFMKLKMNRIDMFLTNKKVGLYNAKKFGFQNDVLFLPNAVSQGSNFVAFSQKPGHDILAKKFSNALHTFKQTDDYAAILEKYGH